VRAYTPIGYGHTVSFFLEVGAKALNFYEDYFGVKYPLPKLDFVSFHSMHVRAMENWGCIAFMRDVFLTGPEETTAKLL